MQLEHRQWKIGVDLFLYNNKLERVSQSTTMRINRREVSADFKNSRHRETTIMPTKMKIKIIILNTFYGVTEFLPLSNSEQDDFPDCRSCTLNRRSLAPFYSV